MKVSSLRVVVSFPEVTYPNPYCFDLMLVLVSSSSISLKLNDINLLSNLEESSVFLNYGFIFVPEMTLPPLMNRFNLSLSTVSS